MLSWRGHAACRDLPKSVFFPEAQTQREQERLYAQAREVCKSCPVIVECREAGRSERYGMWGGQTVAGRIKHQMRLRKLMAS